MTDPMQLAIACARTVEGRTSPRPPVGAVLVHNNRVLATGATAPPYGPHAEIQALNQAGPTAARGADLYTTLEPCCIRIHTPPCTQAIIAAGIRRVIIATLDPNPLISGRGIEQLRTAGIEVHIQNDQQQANQLIRPFATYITKKRPYVTAKWAMTLDGKLATHTGDARWISGPESRAYVHDLRDRVDAILIGAGTATIDNPLLTVRIPPEQHPQERTPRQTPLRVVLATHGQLPAHLHLLQPGTCVIIGETCPYQQRQRLEEYGVDIIPVTTGPDGRIDLCAALQALAQRELMHILIEGGAAILGSAFDQQCIDHVLAFIAPKLIGGATAPSPIAGNGSPSMAHARHLQNMQTRVLGNDILIEGEVSYGD